MTAAPFAPAPDKSALLSVAPLGGWLERAVPPGRGAGHRRPAPAKLVSSPFSPGGRSSGIRKRVSMKSRGALRRQGYEAARLDLARAPMVDAYDTRGAARGRRNPAIYLATPCYGRR